MEQIRVTYQLGCPADEVEERSRAIALEQTVEVPEPLVTSPSIRDEVVGQVASIVATSGEGVEAESSYVVEILYGAGLAAAQISQLLNLVYGNISLLPGIRVLGIELPAGLLGRLKGPGFGIEEIRRRLQAPRRPLLATALKPRGSSPEELAALASFFVDGGGDLVKDDHNLVEESPAEMGERVRCCADAVRRARDRTGAATLYFANLSGPAEQLDERCRIILEAGVDGLLIAPFLLGLDRSRALIEEAGVMALAHPAFAGGYLNSPDHGVEHGLLLGQLMRWLGFDGSVFPNHGGRFGFSRAHCLAIAERLRRPEGELRPAFPVPAGGMQLTSVGAMIADYGADAIFLIGAALLGHGDDFAESTRAFRREIERHL